jgi:hypothetical protein
VSHGLVHLHQLEGNAAVAVNALIIQHTQCRQLTTKRRQTVRKLRHIGPVQTVNAVGAQDTALQPRCGRSYAGLGAQRRRCCCGWVWRLGRCAFRVLTRRRQLLLLLLSVVCLLL